MISFGSLVLIRKRGKRIREIFLKSKECWERVEKELMGLKTVFHFPPFIFLFQILFYFGPSPLLFMANESYCGFIISFYHRYLHM